ncbi:MAG: EAL domain-containing protein [Nitrospiraceae bacterium]|nr:MAG: EAL domain-containing protein [Nitrospiraceae bacterium]
MDTRDLLHSSEGPSGEKTPLCNCALVFRIEDPQGYQGIFGSGISAAAGEDLARGLRDMTGRLLEHYEVLSDVTSPLFGTWYVLFSLRETALPVDMDEQAGSLTTAATQSFRVLLQKNFGAAIGTKMDFKAAVIHIPEVMTGSGIYAYLDKALEDCPPAGMPYVPVSEDVLRDIIERATFSIYLHPVISLDRGTVVGYEALTRGPRNSPVFVAADIFGTAAHYGLRERLELACVEGALACLQNLREPYWIAVNVSPDVLTSREFFSLINRPHLKGMLHRVILEITEHIPIPVTERLREAVRGLEERGIVMALDDAGCGFARLGAVSDLNVSIVKLCITVTSRIGRHPDIERDIRKTVDVIRGMGAIVLGEGVERREQADLYRKARVSLAQGFYFGRPRLASQVLLPQPI